MQRGDGLAYETDLIRSLIPRITPMMADGVASHTVGDKIHLYIDEAFKEALQNSWPKNEFKYVGYRPMTPEQEFAYMTKLTATGDAKTNTKRMWDIAESHTRMYVYCVTYQDQVIEIPMHLPYVLPGGKITISDGEFVITPVLYDRVLSMSPDGVFIRLQKTKVNISPARHQVIVDGARVNVYIPVAAIYHRPKKPGAPVVRTSVQDMSCLAHYLFAKYGYRKVFEKYLGYVPVLSPDDETTASMISDPTKDYVVIKSAGPTNRFVATEDVNSELAMLCAREHYTPEMAEMINSFWFIVDNHQDWLNYRNISSYEDSVAWSTTLGVVVKNGDSPRSANETYLAMQAHLSTLDTYMPESILKELEETGHKVGDFFDLLARVVTHFKIWTTDTSSKSVVFGKQLAVASVIAGNIAADIHRAGFTMTNQMARLNKPTLQTVKRMLPQLIRPGAMFFIRRGINMVSGASATDCRLLTYGLSIVQQSQYRPPDAIRAGATDQNVRAESVYLACLTPSKSCPQGDNKSNFTIVVNKDGIILEPTDPDILRILRKTQTELALSGNIAGPGEFGDLGDVTGLDDN